ncbi:hypothetical protein F5884DRAFT_21957 [Xylogone sp. PMI_703]|nr:hypothetical protein F5884DRAFT_21957 [Xylogone sp. PMI_703]
MRTVTQFKVNSVLVLLSFSSLPYCRTVLLSAGLQLPLQWWLGGYQRKLRPYRLTAQNDYSTWQDLFSQCLPQQ